MRSEKFPTRRPFFDHGTEHETAARRPTNNAEARECMPLRRFPPLWSLEELKRAPALSCATAADCGEYRQAGRCCRRLGSQEHLLTTPLLSPVNHIAQTLDLKSQLAQ
jgi:hypothetical protein